MNYHQLKKKSRKLTSVEQAGMASLLSGIKKLRQEAAARSNVSSIHQEKAVDEIKSSFSE